jgi:hypothetical protein
VAEINVMVDDSKVRSFIVTALSVNITIRLFSSKAAGDQRERDFIIPSRPSLTPRIDVLKNSIGFNFLSQFF